MQMIEHDCPINLISYKRIVLKKPPAPANGSIFISL